MLSLLNVHPEAQCPDCGQFVRFYRLPGFDSYSARWIENMGAAHFFAHGCTGDHKPIALPSADASR